MIGVRFIDHRSERESAPFGPYPAVQLTYSLLRVGQDCDVDLAQLQDDEWQLLGSEETPYSDIVLFPWDEGDPDA